MSKDQKINKWYCAAKTTVVTFTSGLPGGNRNNNGTWPKRKPLATSNFDNLQMTL